MFSFFKRQTDPVDPNAASAKSSNPNTSTARINQSKDVKGSTTTGDIAAATSATTTGGPALANGLASASAATVLSPEVGAIIAVSIPVYRVKNSYVEYVIDVTGERRTWRVYRRYQQFKALDQALRQLSSRGSPNHGELGALPVLPRSHWMEVTNQSAELVDRRRRYLEAYLQQLLVPRNNYYTAHTALYPFLHEGEVPIDTRVRVLFPALLGVSTVNPESVTHDRDEKMASPRKLVAREELQAAHQRTPTPDRASQHGNTTGSSTSTDEVLADDIRASEQEEGTHCSDTQRCRIAGESAGEQGDVKLRTERDSSPLSSRIASTRIYTSRTGRTARQLQELLAHSFLEGEDSSDDERMDRGEEQADTNVADGNGDDDRAAGSQLNSLTSSREVCSSRKDRQQTRTDSLTHKPDSALPFSASCDRLHELLQPPQLQAQDGGGGGYPSLSSAGGTDEELHVLFRNATAEADVRLPTPTAACMNCRREFTSVLFPNRCFFCKHQFCEHCLRPVSLTHTHTQDEEAAVSHTSPRPSGQSMGAVSTPTAQSSTHVGSDAVSNDVGENIGTRLPAEVALACTQCAENFARRLSRFSEKTNKKIARHSRSARASLKPIDNTPPKVVCDEGGATDCVERVDAGLRTRQSEVAVPRVHSHTSMSSAAGGSGYSAAGPSTLATSSVRALPISTTYTSASQPRYGADGGLTSSTTTASTKHSHVPVVGSGEDVQTVHGQSRGMTGTQGPVSSPSGSSIASMSDGHEAPRVAGATTTSPTAPGSTTAVCLDDFQLLTVLGQGTFGRVLKVLFKPSGHIYAMKVQNKAAVHKRCMTSYTIEEMRLLTEVLPPHPYTVHCHFAFQTAYYVFTVIDYLPGGEFFDYVYPRLRLSISDVVFYSAEIVLALGHIHKYDVAHRDLKPENIVMDADGHAHLTDFGLARSAFSQTRRRSFVGSAEYVPPETVHGEVQTIAVDWWSFGVLLYELLAGVPPFHADNNNDVYKNVVAMKTLPFQPAHRFSPEAISLITQLLERDVTLRLQDTAAIQAHPFYATINWTALEARALPAPHRPKGLWENDTRFFKRAFTAEWATVPLPPPAARMTRRSLHSLQRCFSPFPMIHHRNSLPTSVSDGALDSSMMQKVNSEEIAPVQAPFCGEADLCIPLQTTRTNTLERLEAQLAMDRAQLYGTWEITKVEVRALDGRVTYPWGGAVSGMLVYSPQGTFSLQVAPARSVRQPLTAAYAAQRAHRGRGSHAGGGARTAMSDHFARQEDRAMFLEATLNSFSACFGTFTTLLAPATATVPSPLPQEHTATPADTAHAGAEPTAPCEEASKVETTAVHRNFIIRHDTTANLVPDLSGKRMDMYYELEVLTEDPYTTPDTAALLLEAKTPLTCRGDVQNPFHDIAPTQTGKTMLLRLATRAEPVPGETFSAQTVLTWRRTARF